MWLPFAYTDFRRARPAQLPPSACSSRHSIPLAPVTAADPRPERRAQSRASPTPTWSKPFPSDAIALGMLGTPLTSTEGSSRCSPMPANTLSRPEGASSTIRSTIVPATGVGPDEAGGDNESGERAAAGTESGTACRANLATPAGSRVLP